MYGSMKLDNGWSYDNDIDMEEDNLKIFHYVVDPNGNRILCPFTPYGYPSRKSLEVFIKMNCVSSWSLGFRQNYSNAILKEIEDLSIGMNVPLSDTDNLKLLLKLNGNIQ